LDPSHEVWLSAASVWELVIKAQLGKIQLPLPVDQYVPSRLAALGNRLLPVYDTHALALLQLPAVHRDPFDRMLVAQALVEGMQLVS
jgi:PIN domain nuclease of toxin-antitoxin system